MAAVTARIEVENVLSYKSLSGSESPIFDLLGGIVSGAIPKYSSKAQHNWHRLITVGALGLGVAGRWIYSIPAREVVDQPILKVAFQVCTLISWGGLSAWGLTKIHSAKFRPISRQERMLRNRTNEPHSNWWNLALVIISVSSQIPTAYLGYYYTNSFVWPVVMLLADSGLPMISLHSFVEGLRVDKKYLGFSIDNRFFRWIGITRISEEEKTTILRRRKVMGYISSSINSILAMKESERRQLISECSSTHNQEQLFQRVIELGKSYKVAQSKPSKLRRYSVKVVKLIATIVPAFRFIVQAKFASEAGKVMLDNLFFRIFIVALSVIPTSFLTIAMTQVGVVGAYNRVINALSCQGQRTSLLDAVSSFGMSIFRFIALIVGALGIGSLGQVMDDTFDYHTLLGKIIMFTVVPTMFVMTCSAIVTLATEFIEACVLTLATNHTRESFELIDRMKTLSLVIKDFDNQTINQLYLELFQETQ